MHLKKIISTLSLHLFWIILGIGLYLRFAHHFADRSFWEDEAHLAINFINRGYIDLTKPLENYQSAPILFLWGVETFSNIFGNSEISLRSFSFLFSIITLPLFYLLVYNITKNKFVSLLSFACFAINSSLVYYSSELKPYTMDVSVCIILFYLVSKNIKQGSNYHILEIITFALVSFLSNISVVVIITVFIYELITNKFNVRYILFNHYPKYLAFSTSFIIQYFLFIRNNPYEVGMKEIWAFAFVPSNLFSTECVSFFSDRINDTLFANMLQFSNKLFFPFAILGGALIAIYTLYKNKKIEILILIFLPIFIHLILSYLKLYPFHLRFILYLTPLIILLVCIGINEIIAIFTEKVDYSILCVFVFYCLYGFFEKGLFFNEEHKRDFKPFISYVNSNNIYKHVYVSAPMTLYNFYKQENKINNKNNYFIPWATNAMDFFNNTRGEKSSYYYLYTKIYLNTLSRSAYQELLKNNLILNNFEYGSYGILEIMPTYNSTFLSPLDCKGGVLVDSTTIALWSNGIIETQEIKLNKGEYQLNICSMGTKVEDIGPNIKIYLGNDSIYQYQAKSDYQNDTIFFNINNEKNASFKFNFTNDLSNNNSDRNYFLKKIQITKLTN